MNETPQLGSGPFDICKRTRCVWREDGCVRVCWGSWNSIKQMDLFRVSSLLPKKGRNMSLSFANSTQQYAEHISIWLTIFHSLVFSLFLFVLLPLVTAADESRTHLSPFQGHKMRETRQGCIVRFEREEKAWTFGARLLQQGLLCLAWQRGRVTEQTDGASAEKGENRDDPPVPRLSEGRLSQSCVVSKWHEHLGFKNH